MSAVLPAQVRRILVEGSFCHVASTTPSGPHVTPMVFATAAGRMWVTTSRGSVKARAWRRDPRIAGLVRSGDAAVSFTGRVTTYDLLDAGSWGRSLVESPTLAIAGLKFTRKNGRFFAGYAVDAHHVPLAWTPPGRVFAELRIERSAVLEDDRVVGTWGDWPSGAGSVDHFRASRTGPSPLHALPADLREDLGTSGIGALALQTTEGPVVLPSSWAEDGAAVYAVLGAEVLSLAGCPAETASALCLDTPSSWRAREMVGAMIRGVGEIAVVGGLASGERSALRIARSAGVGTSAPAVVRIRPETLVWWRGWSSGTVAPS